MSVLQQAVRFGQLRLGRRLARSMPWIGTALALAAVGVAIRRKGLVGGTMDTALNAIPVVGAAKTAAEMIRGRDFIPDRRRPGLAQDHADPANSDSRPGLAHASRRLGEQRGPEGRSWE